MTRPASRPLPRPKAVPAASFGPTTRAISFLTSPVRSAELKLAPEKATSALTTRLPPTWRASAWMTEPLAYPACSLAGRPGKNVAPSAAWAVLTGCLSSEVGLLELVGSDVSVSPAGVAAGSSAEAGVAVSELGAGGPATRVRSPLRDLSRPALRRTDSP